MYCTIPTHLAYGMLVYIISSIFYLLKTRTIGTPFYDSLTERQKIIKKNSANVRRNVFYQGIILGILITYFIRPFKSCIN